MSSNVKIGHKVSVPREDQAYLDPEHCPHANVNYLKSTKELVRFFCMDCRTTIDQKPRKQHAEDKDLAKRVEQATSVQKTVADRVIKDPEMQQNQAALAIELFSARARTLI